MPLAPPKESVVPAKAGTHIPEAVVMGPRFRGDDRMRTERTESPHLFFQIIRRRSWQPRPPAPMFQDFGGLARASGPACWRADRLRARGCARAVWARGIPVRSRGIFLR